MATLTIAAQRCRVLYSPTPLQPPPPQTRERVAGRPAAAQPPVGSGPHVRGPASAVTAYSAQPRPPLWTVDKQQLSRPISAENPILVGKERLGTPVRPRKAYPLLGDSNTCERQVYASSPPFSVESRPKFSLISCTSLAGPSLLFGLSG